MRSKENLVFGTVILAFAIGILSGCRTTSNSSPQQTEENQPYKNCTLLLRIVCSETNHEVPASNSRFNLNLWRMVDADGRIEVSPKMISPPEPKLSGPATDQGWRSFVVEPGTYFVELVPAEGHAYVVDETNSRPVFYLNVPTSQRFAYAGTIDFRSTIVKHGDSWLNRTKHAEFTFTGLKNEIEAAKAIAGKELAGAVDLGSCLFVPYDLPAADQKANVGEIRSGLGANAVPFVGDNTTRLQRMAESPYMVPGEAVLAVLQGSGSGNSGEAGAIVAGAGVALLLVGAPIALTSDAIMTHSHRKKWAPYQASLVKEVSEFDLNKRLQERLAARIGGANIDSSAAPRFCMRVQAYRVFLRDYGHQKFALEVAARVQLLDSSSGRLLWEHNYVCGTNQSQVACNPSETEVASTVSPRRLEDFGGDAGAELIRNELQSAVNDLTKEIANRI